MFQDLAKNIKKARLTRGLTQEQLANTLGVSRPTYINIESGDKDPTAKELEKLSIALNVSIAEFFDEPRNNEKFKQMYFYILQFFKKGIPKTKLAKLLYFADFRNYYEELNPMSGVRYIRREYGPVADIFFEMTDNMYDMGEIDIVKQDFALMIKSTTYQPQNDMLSGAEKKRIKEICELWKDKRTEEIVKYTHEQKTWRACKDGEYIPYSLIIQENPDHVYTPIK